MIKVATSAYTTLNIITYPKNKPLNMALFTITNILSIVTDVLHALSSENDARFYMPWSFECVILMFIILFSGEPSEKDIVQDLMCVFIVLMLGIKFSLGIKYYNEYKKQKTSPENMSPISLDDISVIVTNDNCDT